MIPKLLSLDAYGQSCDQLNFGRPDTCSIFRCFYFSPELIIIPILVSFDGKGAVYWSLKKGLIFLFFPLIIGFRIR